MTRKERLIQALETENKRLDTNDHRYAIHYLRTGEVIPFMVENYELLDAVMHDIETTYHDYGIDAETEAEP